MARLTIAVLGSFQAALDGESLIQFEYDAARALLAYLALHPDQAHRREVLAGLFWPDQPEATALHNLRQVLNRLRLIIGDKEADHPLLLITRKDVQLNPTADYWLDATEFTAELTAAQQHRHRRLSGCPACQPHLIRALQLYRGDFLDGFSLNSLPFQEWLRRQRERFHYQAMEALVALTLFYEDTGAYDRAISCTRRQIALEPWREEAHQQLMRLLALSGQRSAALAQFTVCQRILDQELGVAPMPETAALYEQIKAGQMTAEITWRHNLPSPTAPLLGREKELAQLTTLLTDIRYRLITVTGLGGVGKTRLALAAARQAIPSFADGVWFVSLMGMTREDVVVSPHKLVAAIATAVGLTFSSGLSPTEQLFSYLREKELLLFLDNFEQLLPASSLILDILHHAPGVSFLVTSRETLRLKPEYAFALPGLPVPETADPHTESYASIRLFAERADQTPGGFCLDAGNLPHVVAVCRLVEGNPLAIELAAEWIRLMPVSEIVAEIRHGLAFLTSTMQQIPERHRSMQAVFTASWKLLSPPQRTTLAQLSVFRSGFTRAALLAVAHVHLPDLMALLDKSLVYREPSGRYGLHELVRQFAALKLTERPLAEVNDLYIRYGRYYLGFVQQQATMLGGQVSQTALTALWEEIDNIRQAWNWAVAQADWVVLEQGAPGLVRFYTLTGLFEEGAQACAVAVAHLQSQTHQQNTLSRMLIGRLLVYQATFANHQGQYNQAISLAQQALTVEEADEQLAALGHLRWGEALWYQGDLETARPHLEQALALACAGQSRLVEADCLLALGSVFLRLSDYREAQIRYEEALQLAQRLDDQRRESQAVRNLGAVSRNLGNYALARSHYERGLSLARVIGDRLGESAAHNSLGDLLFYEGFFTAARQHYQESLRLARQIGSRRAESIALTNLGIIARDLGVYGKARAYLDQALRIKEAIGFRRGQGWVLTCLSLLHHQINDNDTAHRLGQEAFHLFESLGDRLGQAYSLTQLGHALAGLGRLEEAAVSYQRALQIRQETGQHHLATEPLAGLARVALAHGYVSMAQEHVTAILAYLQYGTLNGTEEPARVYLTCVDALIADENPQAVELIHAAQDFLRARSEKIDNDQLKRSFLENIPAHQQIQSLY